VKEVLITLLTDFNAQESGKFREIESKIKELQEETFPESKEREIDKNKLSQLISELEPFATAISNANHNAFPVVSNIF